MSQGKGEGAQHPRPSSRSHKSDCHWTPDTEQVLDSTAGQPGRHAVAMNIQIQAACLLLLLLASLTSGSVLPHQTKQLADLQAQDSAEAKASLTSVIQRRRSRDTHFPICMFCCGCCHRSKCGMCCKT
ncbi:hepcidin [Elephas maximus indicus]|nr:hepcidin [Elephas maximus indicus]